MDQHQLQKTVFIALGEASVCWEPRPSGIFDSTHCKEVGEKMLKDIGALLKTHDTAKRKAHGQEAAAITIKFLEWAAQYYQQSVKVNRWKIKGSRSKERFTTTELLTIYKNQL